MIAMTAPMTDNTDLPPMRWDSPVSAYRWAVETASRPQYRSPLGVLYGQMVGRMINGSIYGWTPEDYRDLAHTMMGAVANIGEPWPRDMFRFVYGAGSNEDAADSLGGGVGERLMATFPSKTYSQLRRVGEVAVRRRRADYERRQFGIGWYARALGIKRPSLYDGQWIQVIREAEAIVDCGLQRGRMLARLALADKGVIG